MSSRRATTWFTLAATALATPAFAQFTTIWEDQGAGSTTPWTVENGTPSDYMPNYRLGQAMSDFPVLSTPPIVSMFNATGEDPSQIGFATKIGGVASSPGVGLDRPLCLTTQFSSPLYLDTTFTLQLKIHTPVFDSAVIWHDGVVVMADPNPAPGAPNMWITWKKIGQFVAARPGRGQWVRRANARLNGEQLAPSVERRIDDYIRSGDIFKRDEEITMHFRFDPPPPPPGGNNVAIMLELIDVPTPGTASAALIGLACLASRRRRRAG